MIILFVYFFISLNFVFPSEQKNIPDHRKYIGFGKHGKEVFDKFYDYYNNRELLEKIKKDHSSLNFEKIIKDNNYNERNLKICFGYSESLNLKNKFVKTNLVEFIRYSPLYFQSVVNDIKEKQKSQIPIEKIMKKGNSSEKINSPKVQEDDTFFEKYLSSRWFPLIIGSGLFLPGLFFKKEPKIKIPLSLFVASCGGGVFWMWQQQKIKELENLKKKKLEDLKEFEEENKEEEARENEIKEDDVSPISQEEVDKYYRKELITETTEKEYSFANKIIEKLVTDSHRIYDSIGKEVEEEEANREKEVLRQKEEEKKRKEADLANTINTNLNSKNRKALNDELGEIARICSGFETKYGQGVDSIKINEPNDVKQSLIKNIFKLIHISLKLCFLDEQLDESSKERIPQCTYKIFFDGKGELNISGKSEDTTYNVILNKTISLKGEQDNITFKELSNTGFYYRGFQDRGGKEEDAKKHFYYLPSIFKNEETLNTDYVNKLFDLILSYKYQSIEYTEKFE